MGVCGVGWGDCVCVPCVAYGFIFRVCGVWRAREISNKNPFVINNAACDRKRLYGVSSPLPPRSTPLQPHAPSPSRVACGLTVFEL